MPSITPSMRQFWNDLKARDHFGFSGNRACMACLFSRNEGASQSEVDDVSAGLGSSQKNYHNMLRTAQKWGHRVFVWHDDERGGKVYKLQYNSENIATRAIHPPDNWEAGNKIDAPISAIVSEWI